MTKKKAFTLAEVLVTMSILGVIAAMTIPNVMFKVDKRQSAVALKRAIAALDQAVDMSRTEPEFQPLPKCYFNDANGGSLDSTKTQCEDLFAYLKDVMQVQKYCDSNPVNNCMPEYNADVTWTDTERAFMTTDGLIYFNYSNEYGAAVIGIDTNGMKGPNKWGYDVFAVNLRGTPSIMQNYEPSVSAYEPIEDGGVSSTDLFKDNT